VDLGAKALQVRPVALAGRARSMTQISNFSPADRARLYLVVLALQEELGNDVRIRCDLAPARSLWQQRNAYAALLAQCERDPRERLMSDLINPLVITDAGNLKPIAYDFNPFFDVASIETLSRAQLDDYKRHRLADFQMLIGNALTPLEHNTGLVDWFDYCTRLSEERSSKVQTGAQDAA